MDGLWNEIAGPEIRAFNGCNAFHINDMNYSIVLDSFDGGG